MPNAHGSRSAGTAPTETDVPQRSRQKSGAATLRTDDTRILADHPDNAPPEEAREAESPDVPMHPKALLRKIGPSLQAGLRIGL